VGLLRSAALPAALDDSVDLFGNPVGRRYKMSAISFVHYGRIQTLDSQCRCYLIKPQSRTMEEQIVKKMMLFVCLLALCNLSLSAQTSERNRMVRTAEQSAIHVPPEEAPATLTTIYSNLGTSQTHLYDDTSGFPVVGADFINGPQFTAMPFTPKSDSHVSQVQVAVQYNSLSLANEVNLSIYGSTDGVPGTLLAGPVTVKNLPAAGTCCALAVANFTSLAVTHGTQYWVVADTPPTGSGAGFTGVWDGVLIASTVVGFDDENQGWTKSTNDAYDAAGEVLGTIP
jgi:hypothetical protein